jgi:hypothetical protein
MAMMGTPARPVGIGTAVLGAIMEADAGVASPPVP